MDSRFAPVELNRQTSQILDNIRSGALNALYGAASAAAEEKIQRSAFLKQKWTDITSASACNRPTSPGAA